MSAFGCVLDMDDTLYLERDYVRSGFRAVARVVAPKDTRYAAELENHMWSGFTSGQRGSSFDALIADFPEVAKNYAVEELVQAYRNHEPRISLLPGMADMVSDLVDRRISIAVISDGAEVSQAAKARALEVSGFANPVVLTDAWGREWWKPHPRAFEFVATRLDLPPERLVYVGDNPHKDFLAPIQLGWTGIRLRLPGQLHESVPVAEPGVIEVTSVAALQEVLIKLVDSRRG